MFSGHPATSPSSFPADTSYLQSAIAAGRNSLQPGPQPLEDDRGRRRRRRSIDGMSVSHSSTLSPTREDDSEAEEEEEEDEEEVVESREELRRGSASTSTHHYTTFIAPPTETTPLIAATPSSSSSSLVDEPNKPGPTAARRELGIILGYTLPICGTHFLEYSLMVVTVISVGHIGTIELAAASLASITSNVFALSVIQGFCTALDTLLPQAYSSRPKDTSLYALRTFVLLMVLLIPQVIILWNAERLLLLLHQDPRVAERAGAYLRVLSFGLPGYAGFECVRRWLQAQGLMVAPVLTLMIVAPVNVVLNYCLVWGPDWIRIGFIGAPLATAISMNSMFIVSLLYAINFAPRTAWGGLSLAMFQDLGINIRLGIAGVAAVSSEWWCWECVGLASSFLGAEALASQSVLLTSASLFYQIPYALSVACAVRVGNLLGEQRPKLARTASRVTLGIAVVVAGINSLLLLALRDVWGRLFSSEENVIKVVASIIPIVALFQLTDGVSGANGGLLRGAGRAPLGALINLTAYYILGLPIGFALCFIGPKLGLEGLWIGLAIALTWTSLFSTYVVMRLDWEGEAERVRIRMGMDKRDPEDER